MPVNSPIAGADESDANFARHVSVVGENVTEDIHLDT